MRAFVTSLATGYAYSMSQLWQRPTRFALNDIQLSTTRNRYGGMIRAIARTIDEKIGGSRVYLRPPKRN